MVEILLVLYGMGHVFGLAKKLAKYGMKEKFFKLKFLMIK